MYRSLPDFKPMPIFAGGHRMTLAASVIPRRFPLTDSTGKIHDLELGEGNKVRLMLHEGGPTTLILVHGLESSAEATYIKGLCEKALLFGYSVVRMNLRNCGQTMHLCQGLYNAGMSGDVLRVAESLRLTGKVSKVYALGFSLGGNLILKALGEDRGRLLDAGVAICPPVELERAVWAMEQGLRLYELNFLLALKRKVRRKARLFPGRFSLAKLAEIRTIREFDHFFTALDGGYKSGADYYHHASAARVLQEIAVPTLIIASDDDPIVPSSSLKRENLFANKNIHLDLQPFGGHCGFLHDEYLSANDLGYEKLSPDNSGHFIEARPREHQGCQDRFWSEWRALEYCLSLDNERALVK